MPLELHERSARATGALSVEEAEELATWLRAHPGGALALADCERMHTAALQAVLALGARITSPPPDPVLAAILRPLTAVCHPPTKDGP
jgi:hypothetical protein